MIQGASEIESSYNHVNTRSMVETSKTIKNTRETTFVG